MRNLEDLRRGAHVRVEEAGRDSVHARKVLPLNRERLAEVDDAGLARIVRRLVERDIDDVAGHCTGDDVTDGQRAQEGVDKLEVVAMKLPKPCFLKILMIYVRRVEEGKKKRHTSQQREQGRKRRRS